jgi:hypothetical protein
VVSGKSRPIRKLSTIAEHYLAATCQNLLDVSWRTANEQQRRPQLENFLTLNLLESVYDFMSAGIS